MVKGGENLRSFNSARLGSQAYGVEFLFLLFNIRMFLLPVLLPRFVPGCKFIFDEASQMLHRPVSLAAAAWPTSYLWPPLA